MTGAGHAAALGVAVLVAVSAAHGGTPDVSQFVGTWLFTDGQSAVECAGLKPLSTTLTGVRPSIYPGSSSDLIFDLGCHCRVALNLTGAGAEIVGPQTCTIVNEAVPISGQVDTLTLSLADGGGLMFTLVGSNAGFTVGTAQCANAPFSGGGQLTRVDTGVVTCGDDATAVGVVTYTPTGSGACKMGAGREGLQIQMHDADSPPCSDQSGSAGEGPWVLPDDGRKQQPICSFRQDRTVLNFCRVDGARFQPITAGSDPTQFYAVLKLGDRCPNGSVEVTRVIDNEDRPGDTPNLVLGDPRPNIVLVDPTAGTLTTLVFCYFRAAASASETMTTFPDLGFPYAVFHDYVDEQPPWVILKRWQQSGDANGKNNKDAYQASDSSVIDEFRKVIEDGQYTTTFDVARVR